MSGEFLRTTSWPEDSRRKNWAGLFRRRARICIVVDIRRPFESSACFEVQDESKGSVAVEIVSMQPFASQKAESFVQS